MIRSIPLFDKLLDDNWLSEKNWADYNSNPDFFIPTLMLMERKHRAKEVDLSSMSNQECLALEMVCLKHCIRERINYITQNDSYVPKDDIEEKDVNYFMKLGRDVLSSFILISYDKQTIISKDGTGLAYEGQAKER